MWEMLEILYDIDKELNNETLNVEKESYEYELRNGMYRNMEKINNYFKKLGIDVDII